MPKRSPGRPHGDQLWATFLRNHAKAIIACDFFVAATATFRLLYVFVLVHHGSRRLVHFNVTAHPTAAWTLQQLKGGDRLRSRLSVSDPRSGQHLPETPRQIYRELRAERSKSPPRSPMANAVCERLIGTIRRECLDWLIPVSELHLRLLLAEWSSHYNRSRPHMSLGPGVPDPPSKSAMLPPQLSRYRIRERLVVLSKSVLGGLHHEYSFAPGRA
ncbi:MAG: integrase core domain-containing protein [Vicinamibacterales bacterium]